MFNRRGRKRVSVDEVPPWRQKLKPQRNSSVRVEPSSAPRPSSSSSQPQPKRMPCAREPDEGGGWRAEESTSSSEEPKRKAPQLKPTAKAKAKRSRKKEGASSGRPPADYDRAAFAGEEAFYDDGPAPELPPGAIAMREKVMTQIEVLDDEEYGTVCCVMTRMLTAVVYSVK